VGDSLTAAGGNLGGTDFSENTWLFDVVEAGIPWAGGWARPGATTADMLAHVEPVPEADAVVILAGTNDVALGIPFPEIADNLCAIAARVGASRVIVSSIPPLARIPDAPRAFNARLEALASEQGWEFVDAAAGLREGAGWAEGMTVDGVHPTPRGQRVLGAAIRDALLAGTAG
jgi:lysophospholipase L1-like esterase